jgi:hypothetical protein
MRQTIRELFAGSFIKPKIRSTQEKGNTDPRTATDYVLDSQSVQQRLLNLVRLFVLFVPAAWLLIRLREAIGVLNTMVEHLTKK